MFYYLCLKQLVVYTREEQVSVGARTAERKLAAGTGARYFHGNLYYRKKISVRQALTFITQKNCSSHRHRQKSRSDLNNDNDHNLLRMHAPNININSVVAAPKKYISLTIVFLSHLYQFTKCLSRRSYYIHH